MSLLLKSDRIASIAERWARQYEGYDKSSDKGKIRQALFAAKKRGELTEECAATIIGNDSWGRNDCHVCEADCDTLVPVAPIWDDEAEIHLCKDCVENLLAAFPK